MSKSGLFAHFGSKEELQLATVEAAARIFREEVLKPGLHAPRGLPRLKALCDAWFSHEQRRLPGGLLLRQGGERVRQPPWCRAPALGLPATGLAAGAGAGALQARELGQLDPRDDPVQLAFELQSLALGAHWAYQLFDDVSALTRGLRAVAERCASTMSTDGKVER